MASQRRVVAAVAAISVAATSVGAFAMTRMVSPGDAAVRTAPPVPSRVTVPVERRRLTSSVVTRGDVHFADAVPIEVKAADGAVVTGEAPPAGTGVDEGAVVIEVAERPVFVLAGVIPAYRDIHPGATGADVRQLEEALRRLQYRTGPVDGRYDPDTEAALAAFYTDRGYTPPQPEPGEGERLDAARLAVEEARLTLASVHVTAPPRSAVLEAEAAVRQAQTAVKVATAAAEEAVTTAQAALEAATLAQRRAAAAASAAATRLADLEKGLEPGSGAEPSPEVLASARADATEAAADEAAAASALVAAAAARARVGLDGEAQIAAARDQLAVAEAKLAEVKEPGAAPGPARADAEARLASAQAALAKVDAEVGNPAPRTELAFVPALPATVTVVNATLGQRATGVLAELSGTSVVARSSVGNADRRLIEVGDEATIEAADLGVALAGQVTSAADEPSGDQRRFDIVVMARDPTAARLQGLNVKVTIPVASTEGEVLTVPVAAVSATGDGAARVEVEDEPDEPTRFVRVTPGLSADGYVEVRPVAGGLGAGDLVVVGWDRRDQGDGADRRS